MLRHNKTEMKQSEYGLLIKLHYIFGLYVLFIAFAHAAAHLKPIQNTEYEHIGFVWVFLVWPSTVRMHSSLFKLWQNMQWNTFTLHRKLFIHDIKRTTSDGNERTDKIYQFFVRISSSVWTNFTWIDLSSNSGGPKLSCELGRTDGFIFYLAVCPSCYLWPHR